MTDVAEIAKGLSEKSRELIRSMSQDAERHAPYHVFPARYWRRIGPLIKAGLLETEGDAVHAFRSSGGVLAFAVLSETGLEVAAILRSQS